MSRRIRESHAPTLQLLRELLASDVDATLAAIPVDWSIPATAPGAICITVPFSGTVPATELPNEIRALAHSRRADLAAIAWVMLALSPEGRAAVVVPTSFLAETTRGHLELRRQLTQEGRLHGIVRLAAGVYKARSGAVILLLGPTDAGPVWFCDVVDPAEMPHGPAGVAAASPIATRWRKRHHIDAESSRSGPSFFVARADIAAAQFAWSIETFREAPAARPPLRAPHEILTELAGLEAEIFQGIRDLVGVLKR